MIRQSAGQYSSRTEPKILYGRRVVLREMSRADVDEIAKWPPFLEPAMSWANLDLQRHSGRDFYYHNGRSSYDRRRYVVIDDEEETVGTIGLRALDFHRGEGTLGIIIRSDRVGRGLGSDAVRTLVGFGFEELGLERIVLDVAEDNTRAIRCYETVGFRLVGRHMGPRGRAHLDMEIGRDEFPLYRPYD